MDQRVAEDPESLTAPTLDPDGTVKPVIAEVLGDDGALDLTDVSISVHVETENRLHFVVAAPAGEVEGFSAYKAGPAGALRGSRVDIGMLAPRGSLLTTHSGVCVCASEDCDSENICF